jgi:hypothetical protein
VRSVALVLERHAPPARELRQGREHVRELGLHVVVERREPGRVESLDVFVERVHEDREGQVALELGRRPEKNKVSQRVGPRPELCEQAGLANPRQTDDLDRRGRAAIDLSQRKLDRAELLLAPDEAFRNDPHLPFCPSRA